MKKIKQVDFNELLISRKSKQIIRELRDYRAALELANSEIGKIRDELEEIEELVSNWEDLDDSLNMVANDRSDFFKKIETLSPDILETHLEKLYNAIKFIKAQKKKQKREPRK